MKKRLVKRMAVIMSIVMTVSLFMSTAIAKAEDKPYAYGSLDGRTITGSLTTGTYTVNATTYHVSNRTKAAMAVVYYRYDQSYTIHSSDGIMSYSWDTNSATSSESIPSVSAILVGGKGHHWVFTTGTPWYDITHIGTVLP